MTDVGTAAIAFVSLLLVRADVTQADSLGGFVVSIVVAVAAIRVGKRAGGVLMDRAPSVQVQALEAAASGTPDVSETRRVRVRSAGDLGF